MTGMLFSAAIAAAVAYWPFFGRKQHSLGRSIAKTIPVSLLTLAGLSAGQPLALLAALALSAAGDWFLAQQGRKYFLAGLFSFAAAHVAYCLLFIAALNPAWTAGPWFFAGMVIVFIIAIAMYRRLAPHLGEMKPPVAFYCAVIAAMAVTALSRGPDPLLLTGVALFLLSDAILAFETFVFVQQAPQRRWSGAAIWHAYFAGQALIAASFLFA